MVAGLCLIATIHQLIVYVHGQVGHLSEFIFSSEGVTQGCTFGMYTYCVGPMPLLEQLTEMETSTLKPEFADDVISAGMADGNAKGHALPGGQGPPL